jgi:hypothetical protein
MTPFPELLTPSEVSIVLKVSVDTVMRKFASIPGVIDLGTPTGMNKRRYRTIRIPRPVLERFIHENRIK